MENPLNVLLSIQNPITGAAGTPPESGIASDPGVYGADVADLYTSYTDPVTIGWLVGYGALVWILLCAPLMGAKGRRRGAAVLGVLGFVPIAMLAIGWRTPSELDVVNPFMRGEELKPFFWIVDSVTAPGWQWPLVVLGALWIPALMLWMRANRRPAAPQPVFHALLLGLWFVGLRVGIELTAGPAELDFATRITFFAAHLVVFAALYAGRRGAGFGGFIVALLLVNLVVRGIMIGWGWAATVYDLGSWLDVNVITEIQTPPPFDEHLDLADATPTEKWWSLVVIPQLMFAAAGTVFGLVVGLIPYLVGRRNVEV